MEPNETSTLVERYEALIIRVAQLEAENERLKEALNNPQGCGMDGCLFQKYNMDFTRR